MRVFVVDNPLMRVFSQLIGHRGSGMDKPVKDSSAARRFHLSENTLLSFVTAGNMGANYVEFGAYHVILLLSGGPCEVLASADGCYSCPRCPSDER